jgi:intracellular sulfur oxidation DsrE/DsrF family protein
VLKKSKIVFVSVVAVGYLASSVTALADKFSDAVENKEPCPVTAYPTMPVGTDPSIALDLEFGDGAQAITQCLKNRKKLKVVVRVDNTFMTDPYGAARLNAPLFLTNIEKMITQYETTHGLKIGKDIDIRVVFSGTGAVLAATSHGIFAQAATRWNAANPANPIATGPVNPYRAIVERGMAVGMKFYLCQEASRTLGITMANKIPGINFVPAAHAATADFQMDGYAIIIP